MKSFLIYCKLILLDFFSLFIATMHPIFQLLWSFSPSLNIIIFFYIFLPLCILECPFLLLLDKLVFILQDPVKWDFSHNVSDPSKMNYFLLPLGFHSTFYSFSAPGHLSYHLVMIYIPCIFFARLLTIRWHSLFICFCIFGSQYSSWHRACSQ